MKLVAMATEWTYFLKCWNIKGFFADRLNLSCNFLAYMGISAFSVGQVLSPTKSLDTLSDALIYFPKKSTLLLFLDIL